MEQLDQELEVARDLVQRAGALTLEYFGSAVDVEWKADETPVTVADRRAEKLIRDGLEALFPDDAILGEEHGERQGTSGRRWIIDPIDGTQSFIRGVPFYGTLLGLEIGNSVPLGVMGFPALDMTLWATHGNGAWRDGVPIRVSEIDELSQATVLTTDAKPGFFGEKADGFGRVLASAARHRGWGDCYGYALVAMGHAEAMFDPILAPWDCAPLVPILEEAGGLFVDWSGEVSIHGGSGIGTTPALRDEIWALL